MNKTMNKTQCIYNQNIQYSFLGPGKHLVIIWNMAALTCCFAAVELENFDGLKLDFVFLGNSIIIRVF